MNDKIKNRISYLETCYLEETNYLPSTKSKERMLDFLNEIDPDIIPSIVLTDEGNFVVRFITEVYKFIIEVKEYCFHILFIQRGKEEEHIESDLLTHEQMIKVVEQYGIFIGKK